jgi:hypothetical protein
MTARLRRAPPALGALLATAPALAASPGCSRGRALARPRPRVTRATLRDKLECTR